VVGRDCCSFGAVLEGSYGELLSVVWVPVANHLQRIACVVERDCYPFGAVLEDSYEELLSLVWVPVANRL